MSMTNEQMLEKYDSLSEEEKRMAYEKLLQLKELHELKDNAYERSIKILEEEVNDLKAFIEKYYPNINDNKKTLFLEPLYDMYFKADYDNTKKVLIDIRNRVEIFHEKVTLYDIGKLLGLPDYEATKRVYFDSETGFDYNFWPCLTDDDEPYIGIHYNVEPKKEVEA